MVMVDVITSQTNFQLLYLENKPSLRHTSWIKNVQFQASYFFIYHFMYNEIST